ncbi:MAG TPA: hypothetical protein PLL30_05845 [Candidatus Krumholzibacteria bacterium]|nr:hypothetical protein [Candidatus Krumholzibacteria bacterium]HPD71286.1 hypothetical protein [Candidatus Krumholzibacteria bacterium]HRY39014.1 hypothetical protein [Candidatus Krumholzibacteria bacterium]
MDDRLPWPRRLRRRFWYLAARGVLAGLKTLPSPVGRGLCRWFARLALLLRSAERQRARRNLARVFPDHPPRWREALLRQSASALGENLHAALTADRQASLGFPEVQDAGGPDGRGTRAVLRELEARGRGVLLVTAHLGCWELLGAWLAQWLDQPAVVTGTVRNPPVDRLLQDRRRALGLEPLPRDAGARPLLRALDRGAVVGVLLDQKTRAASASIPFLGSPAPTPLGPLRIARRRDVPLLPVAMVRAGGRWVVHHLAPIEPRQAADDRELAARCNRALELLIRGHPDQWVWFHERWADAQGS